MDQNTTATLGLGSSPVSNLEEKLLVRYSQAHTSLDDGGGPSMDDPHYFADQKQFVVGSRSGWKLMDGGWEQILGISFSENNRVYSDTADPAYLYSANQKGVYDGQTAQLVWQNNLRLSKGEILVLGLQGQEEWGSETYTSDYFNDTVTGNAGIGSLFMESQTSLADRFFATLGGRVDDHNRFGIHGTYQAGLAYFVPGPETKLKATYGTGFLAPSLYELYSPPPYNGNPDLKPATSDGFDLGFEQPLGKDLFNVGATYFHSDFNNLIGFVTTGFSGQYVNKSSFVTRGVETFADFKGIKELDIRAAFTYTEILTDVPATQSASPMLLKPNYQAGFDCFYRLGTTEWGTSILYVGARPDLYFDPLTYQVKPETLGSYILVNLRASYQLDPHLNFFARVDNLFDQFYEEIYGFGTPGLSVFAGTKVSF
jgi:vitamin B12 transporter